MTDFTDKLTEAMEVSRENGRMDFKIKAMLALEAAGMRDAARLVSKLATGDVASTDRSGT